MKHKNLTALVTFLLLLSGCKTIDTKQYQIPTYQPPLSLEQLYEQANGVWTNKPDYNDSHCKYGCPLR